MGNLKILRHTKKTQTSNFNPVESNNIIFQYYSNFIFENPFNLSDTSKNKGFKIMQNMDVSKAVGIDNLSGKFLKDGAEILAKPLSEICNLSITSNTFPNACKFAIMTKKLPI